MAELDYNKLREMVSRCQWTFAKTMPWAPHEYIVRGKCPLTDEEFVYFVNMQREHGVKEHWVSISIHTSILTIINTGRWVLLLRKLS